MNEKCDKKDNMATKKRERQRCEGNLCKVGRPKREIQEHRVTKRAQAPHYVTSRDSTPQIARDSGRGRLLFGAVKKLRGGKPAVRGERCAETRDACLCTKCGGETRQRAGTTHLYFYHSSRRGMVSRGGGGVSAVCRGGALCACVSACCFCGRSSCCK